MTRHPKKRSPLRRKQAMTSSVTASRRRPETACIYYAPISSPIGELLLTSDGNALTGVQMEPHEPGANWRRDDVLLSTAAIQLREYFAGERRDFELTMTLAGTDFQR